MLRSHKISSVVLVTDTLTQNIGSNLIDIDGLDMSWVVFCLSCVTTSMWFSKNCDPLKEQMILVSLKNYKQSTEVSLGSLLAKVNLYQFYILKKYICM